MTRIVFAQEAAVDLVEVKDGKNSKAVFFGHLLSPTTYVPEKGTATLGSHIMGYSFSDNLLVGTSSFLGLLYNSPNLFIKYGREYDENDRWGIQFDYLKSANQDLIRSEPRYKMEALMMWGTWSRKYSPIYTVHYNLSYMYFINEGKPHSLRREPFNDQPFQFSLTSLHEVQISSNYGIATEVGVLGVNYTIPNLHGALTFRYKTKSFLFQAGMSFDWHLWGRDKALEYASRNNILDDSHSKELIVHPEFAVQYFF